MSDTPTEPPSFSVLYYFITFLVLGVFLLLSILAAHLALGGVSTMLSLVIAAIKAFIVAFIFMHLRLSSKSTWIFAGAGILWLAILFTFTAGDYLTRGWFRNPPPPPTAWTLDPQPPPNTAPSVGRPVQYRRSK